MSIISHFPLSTPRQKQVKALEYIEKVVGMGYTDIVIAAPTGAGKSLIGATVCSWATTQNQLKSKSGGYALVMQKVLQDQIAAELSKLKGTASAALLKSAVEYKCPTHKVCSIGRMGGKCELCRTGGCTYKEAKAMFLNSVFAVTNYAYFFTERAHVGDLEPRRMLVCDEAHNLSKTITRFVQVEITSDKMEDYAPTLEDSDLSGIKDRDTFLEWVDSTYLPAVKEQAGILASLADGGSAGDEELKLAFEVEQHYIKTSNAVSQYRANSADWAFWKSEDDGPVTLTLRPIEAAPYFDSMLGNAGDVRIYMSAFPGSKSVFCRELGLKPEKVAWLSLSSSFPPENRPVMLATVGSLSRTKMQQTMPSVLRMVEKLANKHPERGLIHTNSYAIANVIYDHLAKSRHARRVIFPKEATKREESIVRHRETEGSILISPSIAEGFDFKGDAARWQIIAKCPWPSLGDKQVAIKAERSPDWYKMEAFKSLLQACGRICRDTDDFGVTYVLDEDVERLLKEVSDHVPNWFKDALVYPK